MRMYGVPLGEIMAAYCVMYGLAAPLPSEGTSPAPASPSDKSHMTLRQIQQQRAAVKDAAKVVYLDLPYTVYCSVQGEFPDWKIHPATGFVAAPKSGNKPKTKLGAAILKQYRLC